MREAVIVSTARTGLAKSFRGGFNDTEAPAMGGHVVRAAVERAGIDPAEVDDCIFARRPNRALRAIISDVLAVSREASPIRLPAWRLSASVPLA